MRSISPLKAAALAAAFAFALSGTFAAATFPGFNSSSLAAAKAAAEARALRPISRVADATWAAANVALSGTKLASKLQVNNTALLPGQITCYYDEVSGIVTSLDDGSGPTCGKYLNAVPVKLGGTKYVSWIDVQLVKGTPYIGRLTFWVKDATTPTFAKGSLEAGGSLPYAVRCGRVDDNYLDKVLDGLTHPESWPSGLSDVDQALESYTTTAMGDAATAEQRKAALAQDLAVLAASEGGAKEAAKLNAAAQRILAPERGRGLATLSASCFSNVRAPVDLAEVADAMRISPLTGDFKLEWGWQNTSAVVKTVASTPLTPANVLSLGNLSATASRILANKSAAVSALLNDPARRTAVLTNKTVGRLNTLQRAFNKTRAPLPQVINAATLRATFTDETLHQQVYIWNDQGTLGTASAGGIPTDNSTFYWIDDSRSPPVAVPDLLVPPPVPGEDLPEGIIELPAGTDPACVSTGTCPTSSNEVNIIGGVCVIMGANYDCLAPGSTCPLGDVPRQDVAGTCPEKGVCCTPPPPPPPPPFVADTPTPTTPPATAPPIPTPAPPPPAPGPPPPPPPPPYECPFGLLPTAVPPLSIRDCAVKSCTPCGSAAPDLYQTGKLSIWVAPSWTPSTAANSATLVCSLDYADPAICSQASQSQNAACTTNDIAVDGNGDFIVLGRSGSPAAASGWVIRVSKPTAPGFPCKYTALLTGIVPWAGLGAAPKSNLLYGIGDGTVFTVELFPDGTAAVVSQLAFPGFTGAGDITSAPGPPGNLVYAVSSAGRSAYQVIVDGNFYPTSVGPVIATTNSTYPAAFCTSTQPLAAASFASFARVSSFLSGSFVPVGNSGQAQASGLTGAAVAPVC